MKRLMLVFISVTALLAGCAHPISMAPKMDTVAYAKAKKSKKVVAYHISKADRELEVTTPGGGGDKVSYKPYADLEFGLDRVLSNKYAAVHSLETPDDKQTIADKKIAFVFTPKLTTNSNSDSLFTWPPTEFTIDMDCTAYDQKGKVVWQKTLKGEGRAEFSEFVQNFSLSAERASTAILVELQKALDEAPALQ